MNKRSDARWLMGAFHFFCVNDRVVICCVEKTFLSKINFQNEQRYKNVGDNAHLQSMCVYSAGYFELDAANFQRLGIDNCKR